MAPTFSPGTSVSVDDDVDVLERWDVVVFRPPDNADDMFLSRVVGLPGESIVFRSPGLYINGDLVESSLGTVDYANHAEVLRATSAEVSKDEHAFGPLPDEHYFLLGDNPDARDSRFMGAVSRSRIIGTIRE